MAIDKDQRRKEMRQVVAGVRKDFEGAHTSELAQLKELSPEDIAAVAPGSVGAEAYQKLIDVVEECSQKNATQAELKERIVALGDVAMSIAGKVSGLAKIII